MFLLRSSIIRLFWTLWIRFFTINWPLSCTDINLNETVQIILQLIMMSTVRLVTSSNPTHKLQLLNLLHILVFFSWRHKRAAHNYIIRKKKGWRGITNKQTNHTHPDQCAFVQREHHDQISNYTWYKPQGLWGKKFLEASQRS